MEFIQGVLIAILGIGLVLTVRSFTTLFHELGHAIPSLLFTKEDVKVFIGTYGNEDLGTSFQLGRLYIFFKFNFLNWNIGLCSHAGVKNLFQQLLIIIGGPIASLMIAIPLFIVLKGQSLSEVATFIMYIFLLSALLDFCINMIPFKASAIHLDNGTSISNDGTQLINLLQRISLPSSYFKMENYYHSKNYEQAIQEGVILIENNQTKEPIYELLIKSLFKTKEYEDIVRLINSKKNKLKITDYHNLSKAYTHLERYHEALDMINHCLHFEYTNHQLLCDRALIKIQMGRIENAIKDLEKANIYNKQSSTPMLYRAIAYIQINNLNSAFEFTQKVLDQEPDNPLALYTLGLAYDKKGDREQAKLAFGKAAAKGFAALDLPI